MSRDELSEDVAEGLLHGQRFEGPPSLEAIQNLLHAARGPAADDEQVGRDAAVSAMARSRLHGETASPVVLRSSRRLRMRRGVRLGVVAGVLLSASAAAAAIGSLPDAIQRPLAGVAAHVGVNLPRPVDPTLDDTTEPDATHPAVGSTAPPRSSPAASRGATPSVGIDGGPSSTTAGSTGGGRGSIESPTGSVDPAANGASTTLPAGLKGLCRAYEASGRPKNPTSPAFRSLVAAAAAQGQPVADFCAGVLGTAPSAPARTSAPTVTTSGTTAGTAAKTTAPTSTTGDARGNGNGNAGGNGNANANAGASATAPGKAHGKP